MPGDLQCNIDSILEIKKVLCYQLSSLSDPDVSSMSSNSKFLELHHQLFSMICRTVTQGESNSVLVMGPRGSGKTALIKSVIKKITLDSKLSDNLLLVQLNGLLHTDDRIALKDFARQLTLSVFIDDDDDNRITETFAETFALILRALREERKEGCSILIIMEEFDLFCSHKNQTLLYNLFDVSQSAQTPVFVVGLTSRFDVIELLEKRVKSRFSHRQIHVFHSKSFEDNLHTVCTLLTIPKPDYGWNKLVTKLLQEKRVRAILKNWFDTNLNYHFLKQTLLTLVIGLNEQKPFLDSADIEKSFSLDSVDGKTSILSGLSVLELALVVCILNYTNRTQEEKFCFHVIYLEYQKVAMKKLGMQDISADVAVKAYQRLEQVEVIQSIGPGSGYQNEYKPMHLLVDEIQVQACLESFPNLPTTIKQLASAAIHGAE